MSPDQMEKDLREASPQTRRRIMLFCAGLLLDEPGHRISVVSTPTQRVLRAQIPHEKVPTR